jgi:hypothetical protein
MAELLEFKGAPTTVKQKLVAKVSVESTPTPGEAESAGAKLPANEVEGHDETVAAEEGAAREEEEDNRHVDYSGVRRCRWPTV